VSGIPKRTMSRSSLSALRDDRELDTAIKCIGGVIRAGTDQVGLGADAGGDQSAVQAWVCWYCR
jgi:hypothetical protein